MTRVTIKFSLTKKNKNNKVMLYERKPIYIVAFAIEATLNNKFSFFWLSNKSKNKSKIEIF